MELDPDAAVLVGPDLFARGADDDRGLHAADARLGCHALRAVRHRRGDAHELVVVLGRALAFLRRAVACVLVATAVAHRDEQVLAVERGIGVPGEHEDAARGEAGHGAPSAQLERGERLALAPPLDAQPVVALGVAAPVGLVARDVEASVVVLLAVAIARVAAALLGGERELPRRPVEVGEREAGGAELVGRAERVHRLGAREVTAAMGDEGHVGGGRQQIGGVEARVVVDDHERLALAGLLEEIREAFLLAEPVEEVERALLVLDAVLAREIGAGRVDAQLAVVLGEVGAEERVDDLERGQALEDPAVADVPEHVERGDQLDDRGEVTLGANAVLDPRDEAVD